MQRLRNLHRFAGLSAGIFLFILAITGFLLDHKQWSWLYTTHISNIFLPESTIEKEQRLFQSLVSLGDQNYVATSRGIYLQNKEADYTLELAIPATDLRLEPSQKRLFASTHEGIYIKEEASAWKLFALQGAYVNAMSLNKDHILASVDKKRLYSIDLKTGSVLHETSVSLLAQKQTVSLGRMVRDIHYARGLFDNGWSLWINDAASIILTLLALSGYLIWFIIKRVKTKHTSDKKYLKPLIGLHGNMVTMLAVVPLLLLAITGVILNHNELFNTILRTTIIDPVLQPPIYKTLKEDIWSIDCDDNFYRIGNRLGVYESQDLKQWKQVSQGFAYKMIRIDDELFVSGMGSRNRKFNQKNGWTILEHSPHMFRSLQMDKGVPLYTSSVSLGLKDTSFYSLILSLHDGTFFSSWWVWIYDIASMLLVLLLVTGITRYLKKKKIFFKYDTKR